MSNIYILEPPTSGKVLLKTTVGDIDIELWSKETPKTCRNFIQLCMEGYYDGLKFHRVVKGFIAQGGDPNGDGTGGESIYGQPFKDEFHQRLKFTRRGLLAMANAGKDDNGSQFFFTLAATPELQNLHTIFGKVTGETVFNMLKLEEGLIKNEVPEYPHKIIKAEVLNNPFSDIVPRIKEVKLKEPKKKVQRTPGVKDFKLLSFGEEAETHEQETVEANHEIYATGRGKSTHDVLDDPKLSSQSVDYPGVSKTEEPKKSEEEKEEEMDADSSESDDPGARLELIRNKLKSKASGSKKPMKRKTKMDTGSPSHDYDPDDDFFTEKRKKFDNIKKEIESVKREYHQNKLKKVEEKKEEEKRIADQEQFREYHETVVKYKKKTKELPKKGAGREEFTLSLLKKFKAKLTVYKEKQEEDESEAVNEEEGKADSKASETEKQVDDDDLDDEESWMTHKLKFVEDKPVLAKDANTKDDDWFEIYDPRNPLNKRRRGEAPKMNKKK